MELERIHLWDDLPLSAAGHCLYYCGHVIALSVELLNFTFCSITAESNRKHFVCVNLFSRTAEAKAHTDVFVNGLVIRMDSKMHAAFSYSIFR